jgi:hypothetical protein
MEEDGDVGSDKGVGEEGRRDKEAVEPRGPGMGGSGVSSEMEEGERGVRNIRDREPGFKTSPDVEEGRRGGREGAGGVVTALDEVKVAAKESVNRGVSAEHRTDEILLDVGLALACLKVNIEKLEGLVGGGAR